MKKRYQTIWNHEVKQYDQISRILLAHTQVKLGWKSLLPLLLLLDYFRFKRRLYLTRKNLLLTRQLAFNAARGIHNGKDRNKWFNKVAQTISKIRIKEADHLFPKK